VHIAKNSAIDDALLQEAEELREESTKRSTVIWAFEEDVACRKRQKIADMFRK
jgi:hypothetical protein